MGQEVPALQEFREPAGAVGLEQVHQEDEEHDPGEGRAHPYHHPPARQRQAEDQRGHEQEEHHQVEDGEPAVLGCSLTQCGCHADGESRLRHRVPQQNPENIEEQVAQCDLWEMPERYGLTCLRAIILACSL